VSPTHTHTHTQPFGLEVPDSNVSVLTGFSQEQMQTIWHVPQFRESTTHTGEQFGIVGSVLKSLFSICRWCTVWMAFPRAQSWVHFCFYFILQLKIWAILTMCHTNPIKLEKDWNPRKQLSTVLLFWQHFVKHFVIISVKNTINKLY